MFYCYLHKWSSHHGECPLCVETKTTTSTDTIVSNEVGCQHEPVLSGTYGDAYQESWKVTCWECGKSLKAIKWELAE